VPALWQGAQSVFKEQNVNTARLLCSARSFRNQILRSQHLCRGLLAILYCSVSTQHRTVNIFVHKKKNTEGEQKPTMKTYCKWYCGILRLAAVDPTEERKSQSSGWGIEVSHVETAGGKMWFQWSGLEILVSESWQDMLICRSSQGL
jgi:hypothetical protein